MSTRDWEYHDGVTLPRGGHKHIAPGNIARSWEWPSVWHASFDHERGELPHSHENVYEPAEGLILYTDGVTI